MSRAVRGKRIGPRSHVRPPRTHILASRRRMRPRCPLTCRQRRPSSWAVSSWPCPTRMRTMRRVGFFFRQDGQANLQSLLGPGEPRATATTISGSSTSVAKRSIVHDGLDRGFNSNSSFDGLGVDICAYSAQNTCNFLIMPGEKLRIGYSDGMYNDMEGTLCAVNQGRVWGFAIPVRSTRERRGQAG